MRTSHPAGPNRHLFKLALKNLSRSRFRTAVSIIAIAVGVIVVLISKSVVDGMIDDIVNSSVRLVSGHIRILHEEYLAKERLLSLYYPVSGNEPGETVADLVRELEELPLVQTATARLRFSAMVSHDEELTGLMVVGVDPPKEEEATRLSRYLGQGRLPRSGERSAALGRELLSKLGLSLGDHLTLVFTTSLGGLRAATFQVVGEFASGLSFLDGALAYIPLDTAQELLHMEGAATEVIVMATSMKHTRAALAPIQSLLSASSGGYQAYPYYDQSEYMRMLMLSKGAFNLFYILLIILAAFVVSNTMVMIVNERKREIGMMAALGLAPGDILRLFLYEGFIKGAAGAALGTAAGGVLVWILSKYGILMGDVGVMDARLFVSPRIYPVFHGPLLFFAFLSGIVVTTIMTYLPARRAARMDPAAAIRNL
ncbi:MAG TPA: ABC transporter permease [Firmicutes bacterium]|nr:ABC transporter permease [Bacillota bacterium]